VRRSDFAVTDCAGEAPCSLSRCPLPARRELGWRTRTGQRRQRCFGRWQHCAGPVAGQALIAAALGIETVWANVEEGLPFADGTFDVVVAGELLEHLAVPKAVVDEGRRVLAPGGRLVGSVPNAFRLKSRLRFAVGRHPETDPTHLQLFTPAALRALLADFDSVELRFAVGRYVRLQPRLMARSMIFAARTAAASSP